MKLVGVGEQSVKHYTFRADGTAGTTPTLILPESTPRSYLVIQNISDTAMYIEVGSARAHATITNGVVTSVTVDNAGFNFTAPPTIEFLGGGNPGNSSFLGLGTPSQITAPSQAAQAHCVMSAASPGAGNKVASITVDYGGSGYVIAPYVWIRNSDNDPYGVADPSVGGGSGLYLASAQGIEFGPHVVTTESIAVYCTGSKKFTCLYST